MDKKQNIRTTEKVIGGTVYIVEAVVSEDAKETVEAKVKRLILSNLKPPSQIVESYQLDKEIVDDYFGTETTLTLYAGWKAAAAPSATPSATASTHSKTSNGSIFFPITSAQKFIPATGAGGGNNN